jgi:hypothetical protein
VVANISTGTPSLITFVNDLSTTGAGQGRVTVRHVADFGPVDVSLDGTPSITDLAPGTGTSATVAAGDYDVEVFDASDDFAIFGLVDPLPVGAGVDVIVYAAGSVDAETFAVFARNTDVGEVPPTTTTTAAPSTTTTTLPPTTAPPPPPAQPVAAAPALAG